MINKSHKFKKVIGKRKMMAVPTHLFKIIFLEFINENDVNKSYWLETFVVSNGQDEEEVEDDDRNDEGREEEMEEMFEEVEGIQVEIEMENNIYYNLARDEEEIDQMLKVG